MHPPRFVGNVGIDKEIFQSNHNFFRLINDDKEALRNRELMKLNAPFNIIYKSKHGKKLRENIFADKRPDELLGNRQDAIKLIDDYKINIDIMPKLDGRIAKKIPSPEYRIDNIKIADRKTPDSKNYGRTLSKASRQNCEVVVYNLSKNNDTLKNALESIKYLLSFKQNGNPVHPSIKEVYLIDKNGNTEYWKRE